MNGNFFLVGSARLRQIRVQGAPQQLGLPCFTLCDDNLMESSKPAWGDPSLEEGAQETAWVYQSEASLQEYPIWGTFAIYPGGGYLANLGTNASYATRYVPVDMSRETAAHRAGIQTCQNRLRVTLSDSPIPDSLLPVLLCPPLWS